MKRNTIYDLLALAVLALSIVPVGSAVFVLGFIKGDSPCILCWDQRIGMALIALIGLFVLRYGAKPFYLGLAVLVGVWGIYMGLRHSSLHLARDVGQGFSAELLGAHTYVWSFFIFWCCTAAIAALMMMARQEDLVPGPPRQLRAMERLAFIVFLIVIAGNIFQAFATTGPPPFVGQADPVRFSFNPRTWVWSMGEFAPAPISLRGRWAIEKPDVASVDPDPRTGPARGVVQLTVAERRPLGLQLHGTPTGLAYDAGTDRFLVTTQEGIYLTSGTLDRVLRHTVVDPLFAVDLGRLADGAFIDSNTVIAVGENKSFVVLKERAPEKGSAGGRNFRYFLESPDDFDEASRSRFVTVRGKMMYVMSAAFDPATRSVFTITVPNAKTKRMVVSRFDASDMTVSEEFVPKGADKLEEFYVTGATFAGGRLYLLSAAHATLLAIDPGDHLVTAAQIIPGLKQPTGIAAKGSQFYIVSADGTLTIVNR
jgi:disulfide bond formation protein DsbB